MPFPNTNCRIKEKENRLLRVNTTGINEDRTIDEDNFEFHIYSCDLTSGDIRVNETLNLSETQRLKTYLEILGQGDNQNINTEGELVLILNNFTSINHIQTVKSMINKLGSEKLNLIKESLNEEELNNLNASIKQTLYKKEIKNLKLLMFLEQKHLDKTINFIENLKGHYLEKYLCGSNVRQIEKVFENWLKNNLWVLDIEFYEDLKIKNLKKYIPGGKNVLPDLVSRNKYDFLSLIEIKRPFETLFKKDTNHNTLYKSPSLSKAIAQCIKYLRCIEETNRKKFKDDLNTEILRPKIRLLFGSYSKDPETRKEEKDQLRCLNFHLNSIEIITYDDLIEMGNKIISSYDFN